MVISGREATASFSCAQRARCRSKGADESGWLFEYVIRLVQVRRRRVDCSAEHA